MASGSRLRRPAPMKSTMIAAASNSIPEIMRLSLSLSETLELKEYGVGRRFHAESTGGKRFLNRIGSSPENLALRALWKNMAAWMGASPRSQQEIWDKARPQLPG
jgi:hypothetical protein